MIFGMFDPSVAALFPLPLSTFERYMLLDDRPDYPMVFVVQLKLSGEIRRPAFESSFEEALSRHPLLCALLRRPARSGPEWMLAEDQRPAVDWDVLGAAIGSPRGERIDLGSEVGLRVWVRQGDGAAEVTLQFHHACCDGIGALRFIGHLLAAYGTRTASADRRPTLHPCDPASLVRPRAVCRPDSRTRGSRARRSGAASATASGGCAGGRRSSARGARSLAGRRRAPRSVPGNAPPYVRSLPQRGESARRECGKA